MMMLQLQQPEGQQILQEGRSQHHQLAALAQAIAHPARIAILQHLVKINACICGDLVEEIGLAQPTISQHLKELKTAGIIQGTIEGTSVCYCIDPKAWMRYGKVFAAFFTPLAQTGTCC